MRIKILLVVFLATSLSGLCHAAAWQKFSSAKGDFAVLMPGKPVEKKEVEKTANGSSESYTFTFESPLSKGPLFYIVGYSALSDEESFLPANTYLNVFRDGMLEDKSNKLVGERSLKLKNYPGRLIRYRDADGILYSTQVYRVQQRMYYLMTATVREDEKTYAPAVARFFDSFEILDKLRPSQQTVTWRKFSPPEGGFSVLMPGTPSPIKNDAKGAARVVGVNSFSLLRGSIMYVTVHQELDAATGEGEPDQFFNGFRDGMLKASKNSRIVSEKTISLHEFPGREIRHTDGTGFLYKTRAYLVGHRIYAISAVTPTEKQSESAAEVEKFLDSFELLQKPAEETPVKPA